MALNQQEKQQIVKTHGRHEKDTGSPEVQISTLTKRIADLTEHLKTNKKDYSCQRGLMTMVSKRRRLQNYFKANCTPEEYQKLIKKLKLRK